VTLARNTLWLMMAQGIGMLGPLVMVPFLARALGPEGWGPVLAAQALAAWLILILDYASDLSGTRDIARARHADDAKSRVAEVFRDVLAAKLLLIPLVALIALLSLFLVPVLHGQGPLLAWTLAYAVCRGLNAFWYFQGMERVRFAASADAGARALSAFVVVALVREPGQGWMVLAEQAVFAVAELVILTWAVSREIPLLAPTPAAGVQALRRNGTVFGIRALGGVYTQASTLLLGAVAAPAVVATYGGADRIIRAFISLIQPVTQAILPRVSHLHASDPREARRFVDVLLVRMGVLALLGGVLVFAAAPLIVTLFLGPDYASSIPVLRTLALLVPVIAVSTVFWTYWAIPFGWERRALTSVALAAVTNLALVAFLAPRWGALGMSIAVIAAEVLVVVRLSTAFARSSS
jgi:PST family polysaccharide transporter